MGSIAQWLAYLLLDPAAPSAYHGSGDFFSEKFVMLLLIDSTQFTVKSSIKFQTKPAPASGKLRLQKTKIEINKKNKGNVQGTFITNH